jgi:hypothetical protein
MPNPGGYRSRRAVVVGVVAAAGVGLSGYHVAAGGDEGEPSRDTDERPADGPRDDDRELPPAAHERLCRCPSCMVGLGAPGQ